MKMNIWSDCKKLPLTEVLSFIVDNRGKTVPTTTSGHILIATNCIKNDRLYPCYEKIRFLSEDTYQSFFRSHPIPGDILFVCKGTPGRCALVPDPIDFCIAQDMVGLRTNKSIIDNKYLLAVLRSYEIQKFIYNTSVGDVIPHFKKQFFNKLLIPVPPMELQTKIGAFYYSISQKIENKNKINANLEAQAEALFKSWFVDFTPFKDQPFVDSELGSIPQGWKVGKLGDICTFKRGKNLLSKNAIDEGVPVVAGGLAPSCYHNQANTSAPVVTVSGSGANAGFMRMYHVDVWASDCSFIDVSCDYLYFVYCFLSVNRRLLKHAQTGAVQPHVKPADIHDFDVVIPEEDIVKAFQSIIKELLTKVGVNEKENQRLAALRDTLLPKLMSGEIKL